MKYILFSDYDGTIKPDENLNLFDTILFDSNINAINKFQQDNQFVITTARSTDSILEETKKYSIGYDYITSLDGLVTIDSKNEIVYSKIIEKDILNKIKIVLLKHGFKKVYMYNSFGRTNNYENIVMLIIDINNKDLIKYIIDILEPYKELNIKYNIFSRTIFISYKMNKSKGISTLLDKINIDDKTKIITVGDNINDIEMLEDYNGYKVLLSNPYLYSKKIKTTLSVKSLIKKIEGENNVN